MSRPRELSAPADRPDPNIFFEETFMKRQTAVAVSILLLTASMWCQPQDKSKRPSPPGTAEVTFGDGKKVTIEYSRPYAKGREIVGGLVPYDQVWRTGANEATALKTNAG